MLDEVEANDLIDQMDTKSPVLLEGIEKEEAEESGPSKVGTGTNQLDSKLLATSSVKESIVTIKDASSNNGPHSAETMHLTDVERVVDFESTDESLSLDINLTADDTDDRSRPEINVLARSRHTDCARQYTIAESVHIEVVLQSSLLDFILVAELVLVLGHDCHEEA